MPIPRNVPRWERVLRALAGIALVAAGLVPLGGSLLGAGLAVSGIVLLVTGFAGYCPACALTGRRIDPHD